MTCVLLRQPVEHGAEVGLAAAQVGEHRAVLERVVAGDDPAVRLAVRPQRPVVLAHRHGVDLRPRGADAQLAAAHLVDDVAHLRQLAAQVVVDVDEVLGDGRLEVRRVARRRGRPGGLVPGQRGGESRAVVGGGGGERRSVGFAGSRHGLAGARPARPPKNLAGARPARPPTGLRPSSTNTRTAGITSAAKRWSSSGSSVPRMNVLVPCSRVRAARRSAITAEGPRRYSWSPKMLSIRRTACGPRPARSAASSMTAFISPRVSAVTRPEAGQPAVGEAAGEPQHPRLEGAEPDPRCRAPAAGRRASP